MSACSICNADNLSELEELGARAQAGDISFREAARQGGLKYPNALINHMERHYVSLSEENTTEYQRLLDETIAELQAEMAMAPIDVKPLYAVAIANLAGLKDTKPSQQHLIASLKAIHEITGMKAENRLLLDYSRHMALDAQAADELEDAVLVEPLAIEAR